MLKKLQNLLFEDDDVDEEDIDEEEQEEVIEKPKKRKKTPVEKPEPQMQMEETKPAPEQRIQRIDITQAIPPVKEVKSERNPEESVFRRPSVQLEPEPTVLEDTIEKQKPSLGITVEEISGDSASAEAAKPQQRLKPAEVKPAAKTTNKKSAAMAYQFQPVISPIFGVDEKDLSAVQTTAKAAVPTKDDENVSKIISPIYGFTKEAAPSTIQKTVARSNMTEDLSNDRSREINEEELPYFSLDDILKIRDEEYSADEKKHEVPLFPDFDDPSEDKNEASEPFVDNTTVISKSDVQPFSNIRRSSKTDGYQD